jgi:hypothetical protein
MTMRSRFLLKITAIAFVLLLAPVPLLANHNQGDPEYRECLRNAVDDREGKLVDAQREFNDRIIEAMEERRNRFREAWDSGSVEEARDRMRDAESDFRDRIRDFRRDFRERERNARREHRNAERGCRDAFNDREDENDDNDFTRD